MAEDLKRVRVDIDIPEKAYSLYKDAYLTRAILINGMGGNTSISEKAVKASFKEHIKGIVWDELELFTGKIRKEG